LRAFFFASVGDVKLVERVADDARHVETLRRVEVVAHGHEQARSGAAVRKVAGEITGRMAEHLPKTQWFQKILKQ
jgi:hypothetical protein